MSASSYEREFRRELEAEGWTVFRSAGSLGVDLIALKPATAMFGSYPQILLAEVKAFSGNVFRVSKNEKTVEQWKMMCELAKKFPDTIYALRKKGQKTFRRMTPLILEKPYHWDRAISSSSAP